MRCAVTRGVLLSLAALPPSAAAEPLAEAPGTVDLRAANVRIVDGGNATSSLGAAVARAGDVNGDGIPDVIVGAPGTNPAGRVGAGAAYVVFGRRTRTTVDVASLGRSGFQIVGGPSRTPWGVGEQAGTSVAGAGDVNRDGRADVIVGAPYASRNRRPESGSAYVVFGKATTERVDLARLGRDGFRIDGARGSFGDRLLGDRGGTAGLAVAGVGDVNGDGRSDVVLNDSLRAWIVFGKRSSSPVDLRKLGRRGFSIVGFIVRVGGVGDVNGDGTRDLVVESGGLEGGRRTHRRAVYVVFGRRGTSHVHLDALGRGGLRILSTERGAEPFLGLSLAPAGDVNGDGRADVVVGNRFPSVNGRAESGVVYVVFGRRKGGTVDVSRLGRGGFRIDGAAPGDRAGAAVGSVGDLNRDGRAELVVGAPGADPQGRVDAGAAYIVFGKRGSGRVDLARLGGAGMRLDGATSRGRAGTSVAGVGDVNGDGRPDVVIGAPGSIGVPGAASVVFLPRR